VNRGCGREGGENGERAKAGTDGGREWEKSDRQVGGDESLR